MSLANEIVRLSYDAFRRGDVETALAPIGGAFVLEDTSRVDAKSAYVGRVGFMEWLGEWLTAFEDSQFVVDRVLDRGTEVLVLGRDGGCAKVSGVPVENHFGHLWSFRDGEATRMLYFNDWSKALEAAGLSE
jgi:ketosteroid isomerase-like protein